MIPPGLDWILYQISGDTPHGTLKTPATVVIKSDPVALHRKPQPRSREVDRRGSHCYYFCGLRQISSSMTRPTSALETFSMMRRWRPFSASGTHSSAPAQAPTRKQPLRGTHRQSYKVSSYPYCVLNGCDYRICIMKARTFSAHSPTSERNAPLPSNLMREIFEPGVANGKFWTGFTGLTGFFSLNLVNPVAV